MISPSAVSGIRSEPAQSNCWAKFAGTEISPDKEPTPENRRERLLIVLDEVSANLKEGKDPTVSSLGAICAALGTAISNIADGYKLDADSKELLLVWDRCPKNQRKKMLTFLKGWFAPDQNE